MSLHLPAFEKRRGNSIFQKCFFCLFFCYWYRDLITHTNNREKRNNHACSWNHRTTGVGKDHLEIVWPLKAGSARASCPGLYWVRFWISPRIDNQYPTCLSSLLQSSILLAVKKYFLCLNGISIWMDLGWSLKRQLEHKTLLT